MAVGSLQSNSRISATVFSIFPALDAQTNGLTYGSFVTHSIASRAEPLVRDRHGDRTCRMLAAALCPSIPPHPEPALLTFAQTIGFYTGW